MNANIATLQDVVYYVLYVGIDLKAQSWGEQKNKYLYSKLTAIQLTQPQTYK